MFTDRTSIYVKAGDGGDGAVAFHREKYVAAGGPDGGDGGRGGDVVMRVDPDMNTLSQLGFRRKFIARNGENGKGGKMYGKSAPDLVISVPRGTLVRDAQSGRIIKDMSGDEPFVVARGGRGGWGNRHFATPTRQCPNFAKPGVPGEEHELILELKLIADVGLIGFPNVGKSTLLSVVSAARPKIGGYHFTTLVPNLGVVDSGDGRSFVMADIPGLIEGASEGRGLGHDFLRHVERCRLLVHMVDISGTEGRDPVQDYEIINRELESFSPRLAECPQLVVGNKCDAVTDRTAADALAQHVRDGGGEYMEISAAAHINTDALVGRLFELVEKLPPVAVYEPEPENVDEQQALADSEITVRKYGEGYFEVESARLRAIMRTIDYTSYESMQYFQRVLRKLGVIDRLVEAGVRQGDTVGIYDFEFEFVE